MGRKKKFIDKKESSTFHVVHRSQQDKAAEGEEAPSEYVLIPSAPKKQNRSGRQGTDAESAAQLGRQSPGRHLMGGRDHINALGLPNDGYDYEQHFKSLGGGTFVSRSGHVQHFAKGGVTGARGEMGDRRVGKVTIPEGALPSEEMLERQLEAVTISEKVMDGEMQRAIAGGLEGVSEGFDEHEQDGVNWLDDDFVVQAAGVDDASVFDFDAHVARLMEASARETGVRQRTAEDNLQIKGLQRVRRAGEEDSSDDVSGGSFDEALLEGLDLNAGGVDTECDGGGGAESHSGEGSRAVLEAQFQATLADYDSDEWGELDEEDDRVQGQWDPEQHVYANTCMDEFLADKKDMAWAEGLQRLPEGERNILVSTSDGVLDAPATAAGDGGNPGGSPREELTGPEEICEGVVAGELFGDAPRFPQGEKGEQRALSGIGEGVGGGTVEGNPAPVSGGPRLGRLKGLGEVHEDEVIEDEDDGLEGEDFLRSLGKDNEYLREKQVERWDCETIVSTYSNLDNHPSMLGRKKVPRRRPRESSSISSVVEFASGDGGEGAARQAGEAGPIEQVLLSKKTGLPRGVLPERTFDDGGMVSIAIGNNAGEKRDLDETAEEKRQRKAKLKEEKRNKRIQKKDVKQAFSSEAKVVARALANPEATQNRSVFSYS